MNILVDLILFSKKRKKEIIPIKIIPKNIIVASSIPFAVKSLNKNKAARIKEQNLAKKDTKKSLQYTFMFLVDNGDVHEIMTSFFD